jgi:glucose/arabinose dehydrogenase
MNPFYPCLIILFAVITSCKKPQSWTEKSEVETFEIEVIVDSVRVPFGLAFLSEHELLISDRPAGKIIRYDLTTGARTTIKGLPSIYCSGDGGMLDVLPHPDFKKNHWLYYSYSTMKPDSSSTLIVERGELLNDSLSQRQVFFEALPYYKGSGHFGNRLLLNNGYLFITMGDRYDLRDSAQTLSNHLGKIMRLNENGTVPPDNPFRNIANAKPEIWSYGHRNPQGLVVDTSSGQILEHEHGPKGGDELNIIKPAINYGWPIICWGIDYNGELIGTGKTHQEGLEQPIHHYTPSIAPCGMELYTGSQFPNWSGNLFIGALALRHLNRLVLENNKVIKEERLLSDYNWRVRSVKQGPDGNIYVGVDGGMVLRIKPH